jgi:phasin family protein
MPPEEAPAIEPVAPGRREARPAATRAGEAEAPSATATGSEIAESLALPAAVMASMIDGVIAMSQTASSPADAAEKITIMTADLDTRTKAAFERTVRIGEEMGSLAKSNVEAVIASSKAAVEGAEAIRQDARDFGKERLEKAAAAFQRFATAKSPAEVFMLQSDYMGSCFNEALGETTKLSEACMKLTGDVVRSLSDRIVVAAEKVRTGTM